MTGAMRRALASALLGAAAVLAQAQPSCPPPTPVPSAELFEAAQRQAKDRGLLWRIQRDGRTSWLYGTLHLGRAEWLAPGPQVRAAIEASDLVALEIDITDPAALEQARSATPPAPELPQPLRQRLARQTERACLPEGALDRLHPVMQGVTLALLEARWESLDARFGQEFVLAMAARRLGRPTASLESAADQMALLIPGEAARAIDMLDSALAQVEDGSARRGLRRLAQAWEAGKLAELGDYERWCECMRNAEDRAQLQRLNDGRNPALAARIDDLHRSGKRVFAAVGALHMTGPLALPDLLRARGFRVERVAFGKRE
jgi:hypothetical protein